MMPCDTAVEVSCWGLVDSPPEADSLSMNYQLITMNNLADFQRGKGESGKGGG